MDEFNRISEPFLYESRLKSRNEVMRNGMVLFQFRYSNSVVSFYQRSDRKMKRKFGIIALATLLIIVTASFAFSQGPGRRGRGLGPGMADRGRARLDLTQEQREKLEPLQADLEKELLLLRNKIQVSALELQQLWMADELDEEAIMAKSKEISALKNQMEEKMIRHRLDLAKILTKEQRARFGHAGLRGPGYQHSRRGSRGHGRGGAGMLRGRRMDRGRPWGSAPGPVGHGPGFGTRDDWRGRGKGFRPQW
jgi:Spy/CpxP family protein refolding chaperone